ncbi:hypothetical protein NDU88_006827 [Pleurodeles waltl]|uniref:Uncharacterized protein n=1 Tax=Pleurodeles waltl TaxID=8319 RepID=A0AAV7MIF8_PLEWA|nr:hypothetical protein NDU88_006827 [Pleurodeles waltl]
MKASSKEDPEEEKRGRTESNKVRDERRGWHAEDGETGEAEDVRREEQEEKTDEIEEGKGGTGNEGKKEQRRDEDKGRVERG